MVIPRRPKQHRVYVQDVLMALEAGGVDAAIALGGSKKVMRRTMSALEATGRSELADELSRACAVRCGFGRYPTTGVSPRVGEERLYRTLFDRGRAYLRVWLTPYAPPPDARWRVAWFDGRIEIRRAG